MAHCHMMMSFQTEETEDHNPIFAFDILASELISSVV